MRMDPASRDAPYEQVRIQIAEQIDSGGLRAGDRLPTVRRLAEDLGLAVNTVARAYRELERDGLIDTRGRAGSFVTGTGVETEARAAAAEYVSKARALGLEQDRTLQLVRQYLDARGPAGS